MKVNRFEQLIPQAIEIIKKEIAGGGYTIPSEFNGYIANFGISIRQSGLIPTMAFYSRKADNSKEDKTQIPKIIFLLLKKNKIIDIESAPDLLHYILDNKDNRYAITEEITTAAIAIKLAMRVFKLEEQKK